MRSADYHDPELTFSRLEPQHMVRVALIEGLRKSLYPRRDSPEVDKYLKLVRKYTDLRNPVRLERLESLLNAIIRSRAQDGFLADLLVQFRFDSNIWRNFDYEDLRQQGVIEEVDGDLSDIVEKAIKLQRNKVVCVKLDIAEGDTDYKKHVNISNKLVLDSKDVITTYAALKKFELPETFVKSSRKSAELYNTLGLNGFTFQNALGAAFRVHRDKYPDRRISAITFRRPRTGEEVRFHLNDFVEAVELQAYISALDTLGKFDFVYGRPSETDQLKYGGGTEMHVPKRFPGESSGKVNRVEFHYIPRFDGRKGAEGAISWMYIDPQCECRYGFNLRNFQEKASPASLTKRTVRVSDVHNGVAVLESIDELGLNPMKCPNNLNPIISEEALDVVDNLRYNFFKEEYVPGKKAPRRRHLNEVELEILLHELTKRWRFRRMFMPKQDFREYAFRPMYSE